MRQARQSKQQSKPASRSLKRASKLLSKPSLSAQSPRLFRQKPKLLLERPKQKLQRLSSKLLDHPKVLARLSGMYGFLWLRHAGFALLAKAEAESFSAVQESLGLVRLQAHGSLLHCSTDCRLDVHVFSLLRVGGETNLQPQATTPGRDSHAVPSDGHQDCCPPITCTSVPDSDAFYCTP